jgi:hypothetical protein
MPNFLYKNITDILRSRDPIRGERFLYSDLNSKIIVPKFSTLNNPEDPSSPGTNVELHVFLPNSAYFTTLYYANYSIDPRVNEDGEPIRYVNLPIHDHIRQLNLIPGPYRIVYNFFRDLIGSNDNQNRLFISDLSSDRKELRLTLTNPSDLESIENLTNFVVEYMRGSRYKLPIVLNFGENNIVDVINVTSDGNPTYFFVKLAEPLPFDVDLYYQCWLSSQIMKPYIDSVQVEKEFERLQPRFIKGPNFEVEYDRFITGTTEYKNWTDLLSTNVQTSQQILDKYINVSGSNVSLNYDFTEFKNFVFYSSAEERVENFYYKIRLIENYNTQLSNLEVYTGSLESNKTKVKMLRDKVVSGFDEFEKWLYYETSASLRYTSELTSSIKPFPKYEVTGSTYDLISRQGKFNLYQTTSTEVENWYNNILDLATDYDMSNSAALVKALPDHVYDNPDNNQIITFVNMLAQHFDVLYYYTDHILKKNLRLEHPKDGVSQDLIYEVTRNLGWTLSSGTKTKDLWEYALGLSGSGEPIWTGRTTVGKNYSKSEEERTKEVWRRVLNNLPYIYKSKGTSRGIKALLAAYGIPQTLLSIREYGGPDNADLGIIPRAEWEKHTYYLEFVGSRQQPPTSSYVKVPWERVNNENNTWQFPDTLTFRWKMNPSKFYDYEGNKIQTLLQKETTSSRVDWFVTVNRTGSDEKGDLTFYIGDGTNYKSASIKDEYLYDDIPLNIMIRRNQNSDNLTTNQTYDFILKTEKYGKIVVDRSASISVNGATESNYNRAWSSDGNLFLGSGSNQQTYYSLSGSIFELRYWTKSLITSSFDNHVLAARSYNGNTSTSSFYDLQGQWKFWQPFNAESTSSIKSVHPDQTKNTFYSSSKNAYFHLFNRDSFIPTVEVYNMEVATVANNTPFSEKIRIDSASLQGALLMDESSTVTAFDRFSIDSNKLMVAFSPQHIINEDIYESIGYTVIDDYLGEYSNTKKDEYPALKKFAQEYWKKYTTRNDFTAYLRMVSLFDFSVFDQIRQTLPVRTNEILGVVVEPNILERSKVKINRDFGGLPPEKFVRDTTEISSSVVISGDISNSKKTTIFVGFDEEIPSEFTNINGEFDIETVIESETDNLEDDIDVSTNLITNISATTASISERYRNIFGQTLDQKATIRSRPTSFTAEKTTYDIFLDSKNRRKIIGKFNRLLDSNSTNLDPSASFNLQFTNTFDRINYIYGGSVSSSKSWYTASNQYNKRTSTFEIIGNGRHDNFYKSYYFYYTSSVNSDSSNYSEYQYVTSSQMNMNNYPQSIRNIRFDGCKLPGGDVLNKISYPMYTPNYTYLDINNDPSALIILVLPFEVLPEWLQQIRESRGQS